MRALERTAVPFLEKFSKSDDPEVRMRIRDIIALLEVKPLTLKFADTKLTALIKTTTGKDVITDKDINIINSLRAGSQGIKSIDGLRNLAQVRNLFLEGNSITDISDLKKLSRLSYLNLTSNNITNLAPLVENVKNRQQGMSFSIYLTGNPLPKEAMKQIEVLRGMNVRVFFVEDQDLPDNMKVLCPKGNITPYAGLDLRIKSDTQKQADEFYKTHRSLTIDARSKFNGKAIPAEDIKYILIKKTRSHHWRIYTAPGALNEIARPMKPGKYTYEFIVNSRNARFKCPPFTVNVAVPEVKKEMMDLFEKSGASTFLQDVRGFRRADNADDPKVNYEALCEFMDKYPNSFLTEAVTGRLTKIGGDDMFGRVQINPDDRKGLAALAIRIRPNYIKETSTYLEGRKKALKQLENTDSPFGSSVGEQQRMIDVTGQWLEGAKEAMKQKKAKEADASTPEKEIEENQ